MLLLQRFRGNLDNWDPALIDALASDRRVATVHNAGVGGSTAATPEQAAGRVVVVAALVVHMHGGGSPSQPDDQVADRGGLGEEWVVAGVEFHDAGCSTGELALQVGRGAPVLRADEVRRGHVLPGR